MTDWLNREVAARLDEVARLLEEQAAAHDGRLATFALIGEKRRAGIRDSLATRLGRVRGSRGALAPAEPPVEELLDVDREYRTAAAAGKLRLIAPRRFNPNREPWLPVLHTHRGDRQYTALFSNTARAHELHRTHDWVVLYTDGRWGERQYTPVTALRGYRKGKLVVRGREAECLTYYRERDLQLPAATPQLTEG